MHLVRRMRAEDAGIPVNTCGPRGFWDVWILALKDNDRHPSARLPWWWWIVKRLVCFLHIKPPSAARHIISLEFNSWLCSYCGWIIRPCCSTDDFMNFDWIILIEEIICSASAKIILLFFFSFFLANIIYMLWVQHSYCEPKLLLELLKINFHLLK